MAATPDPNQPKRPQAKGDFVKGRIVRVMHGQTHTFTRVANALVTDTRLSFKALGLQVYLLSKPDHWSMRMAELVKSHRDGRISIQSARRELETAGYLIVKPRRWRGQFGYVYIVFESPQVAGVGLVERICEEAFPGSEDATLFDEQLQQQQPSATASPAHKTCAGFSGDGTSAQKPSAGFVRLVTTERVTNQAAAADALSSAGLKGQPENSQPAAVDPERSALETALLLAGVGGPALQELLSAYPTLNAGMVEREWERCRQGGKRQGILIANLKSQIEGRRRKLQQAAQSRRTA